MDHPDDTPRTGTGAELVPWAATAEARQNASPSTRKRFTDGIARAALVIAGLAAGAALVSFVLSGRPAVETTAVSKATSQATPGTLPTATERLVQRVTDTLGAMKSELDDLRAAVTRDRDETRADAVARRLDDLAVRLDKLKGETSGSLAQLAAEIEPFRRETAEKLQSVVERLDRLEHRGPAEAGAKPSTPPSEARAPNGPASAPPLAGPVEAARTLPVIRGWVLRDVYDGLALVESAYGAIEVAPGALLPGAGRVKSIERRGRGWIVVTSRGVIDRAPGRFQP